MSPKDGHTMASRGRTCISKMIIGIAALATGCAAEATDGGKGAAGSGPTGAGGSGSTTSGTTVGPTSTTGSGGGTGTGTGTGGSSGAGGGSACGIDATLVISDFELGTAKENIVAGRDGSWFLYNDKT